MTITEEEKKEKLALHIFASALRYSLSIGPLTKNKITGHENAEIMTSDMVSVYGCEKIDPIVEDAIKDLAKVGINIEAEKVSTEGLKQ